jgi:predicted Zn finger-like uncharacterized protein
MNVACSVCFARYTVPDDKVTGRRVRMKCKRCGESITVDGTTSSSQAAPLAASPLLWSVTQPSGRRDKLSTEQLLERYAKNEMEPRTLVWRKGMVKWLPPEFVPELAQALAARGLTVPRASKASRGEDDEATRVGAAPLNAKLSASERQAADSLPNLSPSLGEEPGSADESTQIFDTRAYAAARESEKEKGASLPNLIPSLDQESGSADEATQIFDTRAYAAARESEKDEGTTERVLANLGAPVDEEEATRLFTRAQPDSTGVTESHEASRADDHDVAPPAIVPLAMNEDRARSDTKSQRKRRAQRATQRRKKPHRPLWAATMLVLLAVGIGIYVLRPGWLGLAKDQVMIVLGQAQPRR